MKYLDLIATYLGLSPDAGNGLWELAALVVIVTLAVLLGLLPVTRKLEETKPLD
jgi:uncharacterized membrane protein YhiD involved in acid resistance